TSALFERRDVIIVASVSCIYGLGSPEDYVGMKLSLKHGDIRDRDNVLRRLVGIQYQRNDYGFKRGTFRVRGDVVEIVPAYEENIVRIEFFGDEVERIVEVDALTGEILGEKDEIRIYPATHLSRPRRSCAGPSSPSRPSCTSGSSISGTTACCWRRRGWSSGRSTIWKCCRKWGTARASRTILGIWTGGPRASRRRRCWTISRKTT